MPALPGREFPTLLFVRPVGELSLKSRAVHRQFLARLAHNLEDALKAGGVRGKVVRQWDRLWIGAEDASAADLATRVFGVHSVAVVAGRVPPLLAEIVRQGAALFSDVVRGRRYAVRARRSGDPPFRSKEVEIALGAALNVEATVDLDHPEVTVHVLAEANEAYLYADVRPGPGGLPLGVEGKALALVSGGFDSAVAAWMVMRRGVALDFLLCNLAGQAFERSVLGVAKVLADGWSYGAAPQLHVVDFEPLVAALKQDVEPRYAQIILKRLMYRAAAAVAAGCKAQALVTGEVIGQVSSQTLTNLQVIDEVSPLPVLRPLIGCDKDEIVARSRMIGTAAMSALIKEYCALVPEKPATAARREAVLRAEEALDASVVSALVQQRKTLDLRSLSAGDLVLPYVYIDRVPPGAVVLDCRSAHQYRAWHFPEARNFELDELLSQFSELPKEPAYVLYCPWGVQSAVAAERMQRAGYDAYSFRGGTRSLREYARREQLDDGDEAV